MMKDKGKLERLILAYSPKFQAIMKKGKEEIKRGEGISHEEFWTEMETEDGR